MATPLDKLVVATDLKRGSQPSPAKTQTSGQGGGAKGSSTPGTPPNQNSGGQKR